MRHKLAVCIMLLTLGLALGLTPAAASAASGAVGVSLLGGYAWSTSSDAMEGRDGYSGPYSSSFDDTWTGGAEATYRLPMGLSFGLGVQYLKLTADAARRGRSETDYANVQLAPLYAVARYTYPVNSGITGHVEGGLGYAFASAGKESGLDSMQAGLGENVDIDADNTFCGFVGAGADWFFTPQWSLGLGLRYWWLEPDYEIKAGNYGTIDKGTFQADNLQALVSVTFWFGN
ncbi:MAG: outer membrane beta-barrel protein [Deltaproteobacteria bacterium]|nr:outer membrane beta-barrel protein [Deltaproteobacteria bacterium]